MQIVTESVRRRIRRVANLAAWLLIQASVVLLGVATGAPVHVLLLAAAAYSAYAGLMLRHRGRLLVRLARQLDEQTDQFTEQSRRFRVLAWQFDMLRAEFTRLTGRPPGTRRDATADPAPASFWKPGHGPRHAAEPSGMDTLDPAPDKGRS